MATPSIAEVAAAAGVHKSTVSRAFSNPDSVRPQTRERVRAVAAAMGYSMSPLAQALRTKSSTLVPLLVPDITNPYFAELAKAMSAAAGAHGYQLVLCVTGSGWSAAAEYLRAMRSMYAPFAVIAPHTRLGAREFEELGFDGRLVVIDRVESDIPVPTVSVDSAKGISLAFDHLLALGHHEIAYVSGIVGTHTATDRRSAYTELALSRGMTPMEFRGGLGAEAGVSAAKQIAAMSNPPTAVIAASDLVATGLISALGERGVSVPRDMSVVGFDGLPLGARGNPPLTSVQQPITELGRIAIDLAHRATDSGRMEHVLLEPTLCVRSSTGERS